MHVVDHLPDNIPVNAFVCLCDCTSTMTITENRCNYASPSFVALTRSEGEHLLGIDYIGMEAMTAK